MIKKTFAASVLLTLLPAVAAWGADLRVTDSRGREVVVAGAAIDYGSFMSDKEADGIRVLQGDGMVVVKWTDVESIKVTKRDDSAKPPRVEIDITLRTGKKVPAEFFHQGAMKLLGRTELGEYAIDLGKVRSIVPVR